MPPFTVSPLSAAPGAPPLYAMPLQLPFCIIGVGRALLQSEPPVFLRAALHLCRTQSKRVVTNLLANNPYYYRFECFNPGIGISIALDNQRTAIPRVEDGNCLIIFENGYSAPETLPNGTQSAAKR
eukprot:gene12493-biopygen7585